MILSTKDLICKYTNEIIFLFDYESGVKTIGEFVKKAEELAKEKFSKVIDNESEEHPAYKFKGDMLEILGEIFFVILSADPAVGLINYRSIPIDEDYGVDGIGTNVNGDQVVVQMKYKANPLVKIEYKEISRTYNSGIEIHNIPLYLPKDNTIFIFTTGNGITPALRTVNKNKVRVIDRKIISGLIDNNKSFWLQAEELIMNTLDHLNMKKIL